MRNLLLAGIMCLGMAIAATAAEQPVSFNSAQVDAAVAVAPPLPVDFGFNLKLRLVDYVDFTDEKDFHDLRDLGTSHIVNGPAGKYRETARQRHASFAVRWRAAAQDQPHLLVFEYPDDADRQICFFMHDSRMDGGRNVDWSLESGVTCGSPFPVSGKMQYHTMFFWPSDKYPVAMVMNWIRNGRGAAASRLWVYAIEEPLPALTVQEPDPKNPRILGDLYNYSKIPNLCIYGGRGPETAFSHMVDYHFFRGDNLIAWPVVYNNDWGFRCTIPAWDGGTGGSLSIELDQALAACEKRGMKFLPIFNTGFEFKMGGKKDAESDPAECRALIEKGFRQFMEKYGSSPVVYGIAFDSQDLSPKYGVGALDQFRKSFGTLAEFRAFLRGIAPDMPVFNFLGGRTIHEQYFRDAGDVLKRWEACGDTTTWSRFLADEISGLWTSYNRNPAEMNADGIDTIMNYQVDDARIFNTYYQNPRAAFYWDVESSTEKAGLIDTRKAMVWNTFYEAHIGLTTTNWWYRKLWVAPDFNPAPPLNLYGQILAMSHRDRDLLLTGAWGLKGSGVESSLRDFAKAFRALPPVELQPLPVSGSSALIARSALWENQLYLNIINPVPFTQTVMVNGKEETLSPFSMQTRTFAAGTKLSLAGGVSEEYRKWVAGRLDHFAGASKELATKSTNNLSESCSKHLSRAQVLFDKGDIFGADRALGFGLSQELDTRLKILSPQIFSVPKLAKLPGIDASLDQWPAEAADQRTDDAHIATHLFFPGQWEGREDLSLRIRAAHNGEKLAIGVFIYDQDMTPRDGAFLHFSPENYLKLEPQNVPYETTIALAPPAEGTTTALQGPYNMKGSIRKVAGGYEAALFFDLSAMPLRDGKRIGWLVGASDDDPGSGSLPNGWARKQAVIFPNDPVYQYWDDARTCGELVLE